jgi:hypothetical protein
MSDTATVDRPHVVKDAKGKRPDFYEAPGLDQAMSMIMVLAGEMAVLHDRLDSAERVMAANGVDFLDRLFYLMRKDAAEAARAETAAGYRQTIEDIAVGSI